jgi:hypothetical protein
MGGPCLALCSPQPLRPHRPVVSTAVQELDLNEFKLSTFRGYSGDGVDGWSSVTVASRCLHVGNVAGSMTEEKLRQQFSPFGKIEALKYVGCGVLPLLCIPTAVPNGRAPEPLA